MVQTCQVPVPGDLVGEGKLGRIFFGERWMFEMRCVCEWFGYVRVLGGVGFCWAKFQRFSPDGIQNFLNGEVK